MPFLQNSLSPSVSVDKALCSLRNAVFGALLLSGAAQADSAPVVTPIDTPPQVVFEVVLAEIALKRDKPQVAMAAYADLALKYNDPGIFRRTLEIAAVNRRPELMLETARLWSEREPESTDALNALSGIQMLLGRYDEAQPVLVRYLAALPPDQRAKALLQLPQRFPPQADAQRARKFVDGVTAPYLSTPEALLARAQMAYRAGDEAAALQAVQLVRRLQPDSEAALLLNAQIDAKRSPEAVLSLFANFLVQHPKAATIRALYAQQLLSVGRLPEARAEVARLLEQSDVAPEPLFAAAAVAVQAQAPSLAVQALNRLLLVDTIDTSLIQYNLGLAFESQADLDRIRPGEGATARVAETEAVMHYMQVRRGDYFVPSRLRAASLMARAGNLSGARALLQNTPVSDAAARAELVVGEATLASESGDKKGALHLLERAVSKDPGNVTLRYELGMTAERLGRMDLFESSMRAVIRKDPKYAQAYNALGFTYVDRNERLKEARVLIEKALSLAPNDPFILDSMGWLCYREKKLDAALDYLNRAASLRADPEIVAHQIEVLRAMGRHEDAVRVWRAGSQRFPDNAVLQALGKTLQPSDTAPGRQDL